MIAVILRRGVTLGKFGNEWRGPYRLRKEILQLSKKRGGHFFPIFKTNYHRQRLAEKSEYKFRELFKGLFKPLCGFAMKFTGDLDTSKNLVHEVFIQLWEKFDSLPPDTNYKSYCYTAVRNRCLNHIRDKKKFVSIENVRDEKVMELNTSMETSELGEKIEAAISSLPEKCRMVFELNRVEGLKYAEIAVKLNISIKTVEAQMSKALGIMREHLREFLCLIFILFT